MLNIKWPDKITNQELKEKVKFKLWSETIWERRLKWLGQLCRLDEDCQARLALKDTKNKKQLGSISSNKKLI